MTTGSFVQNNILTSIEVDGARQKARLRVLKSEQEYEAQYRGVERVKLLAIQARFPSRSETARYILAQLLTDEECIVCGNHVPKISADYASRIESKQCVICGSDLANSGVPSSVNANGLDSEIVEAINNLERFEASLGEAQTALQEAESDYTLHFAQTSRLHKNISDRSYRIQYLVRQLPPEEAELHKRQSELGAMHSRVEVLKTELTSKRRLFREFIEKASRDIAKQTESINTIFNSYAKDFLLEQCELTWSPQKSTIGETGTPFEFPAFELDMTGADFPSPVRRSGPEQVSESQREFIDLAFRMALMSVASDGASSLVMDAPESSLDVVFTPRAADVLSRFARPTLGNRLVITSNLAEGQLIPNLVKSIAPGDRAMRVVDLVEIAVPTAAVREQRAEYEKVLHRLLTDFDEEDHSQ